MPYVKLGTSVRLYIHDAVFVELTVDEARNLIYDASTSGVLVGVCDKIKRELIRASLWGEED